MSLRKRRPDDARPPNRRPTRRWSGLRPAALVGYLARVASGPKPLSLKRWAARLRIILRIISLLLAVGVFYTAWFALWFLSSGRLKALLASGALGPATLIGWTLVFLVGPYAAVQLWRLRRSGLYAAASLLVVVVAYYVVGAVFLRTPDAPLAPIVFGGGVNAFLLALLLSSAASRVCSK